jgi:hypothetical protein
MRFVVVQEQLVAGIDLAVGVLRVRKANVVGGEAMLGRDVVETVAGLNLVDRLPGWRGGQINLERRRRGRGAGRWARRVLDRAEQVGRRVERRRHRVSRLLPLGAGGHHGGWPVLRDCLRGGKLGDPLSRFLNNSANEAANFVETHLSSLHSLRRTPWRVIS